MKLADLARRALPSRLKRAIKSRLGMPMTRLHSDWEIHEFEPAIEAFERGKSLYGSDPSIHIINAGLGSARGTLEFNVLESSRVSNSFLQPVELTWKEIDYHTGAISK